MNGFEEIIPNTVIACIEPEFKILWVEMPSQILESLDIKKDLHIYDINRFWMNIREKVKQRTDARIIENE